jgi:hypothetical protein
MLDNSFKRTSLMFILLIALLLMIPAALLGGMLRGWLGPKRLSGSVAGTFVWAILCFIFLPLLG